MDEKENFVTSTAKRKKTGMVASCSAERKQSKDINTTTRNVFFDRRFAQNGFAPPWYPSTTVTTGGSNSAAMTTTIQRTKWFNRTTY